MVRRNYDRIGKYHRREVLVVGKDTPVLKAIDLMERTMMNTAYVVENGELIGFLNTIYASSLLVHRKLFKKPLDNLSVKDIMEQYAERDERVVSRRQTVKTAAEIMVERELDELPVVDSKGNLIGRITIWDVLRALENRVDGGMKVKTFATDEYVSCNRNHSVYYLICQLPLATTKAIIVQDDKGTPVGIVFKEALASFSLLTQCRRGHGWRSGCTALGGIIGTKVAFLTAEDIMSRSFIEVREDDDLKSVIGLMIQMRSEVYPVVNDEGKLTKIVTAKGIIRRLLLH